SLLRRTYTASEFSDPYEPFRPAQIGICRRARSAPDVQLAVAVAGERRHLPEVAVQPGLQAPPPCTARRRPHPLPPLPPPPADRRARPPLGGPPAAGREGGGERVPDVRAAGARSGEPVRGDRERHLIGDQA